MKFLLLWALFASAEFPPLSVRFPTLAIFPEAQKVAYGDARGYLHILERGKEGYREAWRSSFLGSPVGGVLVEDIDDNGRLELVVFTSGGRIYILDGETYSTSWQNQEGTFGNITAMAVANLDSDPQKELVFCADERLYIYDGESLFGEWESEGKFQASQILVGDVDGDGELELVLNTGFVVGVTFHDIKWALPGGFGEHITLLDVDDDGVPEVLGESGGLLRVFDAELQRELR